MVGSPARATSSDGSSLHTPLHTVKREAEELPSLLSVKREPMVERSCASVIGREDYLPPSKADAMEAEILERSAREEEEVAQCHGRDEEINQVMYESGLAKAWEFDEKIEAWRREADTQDSMYIDLTSDNDDK
ncbi:hypothetical protein D1007_10921 [Hordeum vulgare]|nr:hypothetical protein D1007_10921 [Hordeum vulgare]